MLKKLLSKLNIIDIIIIIASLIVISSLAYRIVSQNSDIQKTSYIIHAVCNSCPDSVSKIIKTKPECFNYETNKSFGKIVSVSQTDSNRLLLDIQSPAIAAKHGISVNGTHVLIGKHINLIAGNAVFTVLIEDFQNKEVPIK